MVNSHACPGGSGSPGPVPQWYDRQLASMGARVCHLLVAVFPGWLLPQSVIEL